MLGTAVHGALASWITSGEARYVDAVIAAGLEPTPETLDEVRHLATVGMDIWSRLSPGFSGWVVERAARRALSDHVTLTGHPDVVAWLGDGTVIVIDWKSGWLDVDAYHQLMGYVSLSQDIVHEVTDDHPATVPGAKIIKADLRAGEWTVNWPGVDIISPAMVAAWEGELLGRLELGHTCPGDHCTFCPERLRCDALRAYSTAAFELLVAPGAETEVAPRSWIAENWGRMRAAKALIKEVEDRAKDIIESDGPITLADGSTLQLQERRTSKLDLSEGLDLIEGVLYDGIDAPITVEQMVADHPGLVSLSLTQLWRAVMDQAPRGEKTRRRDELKEKLRDAGAITENISQALRIKRAAGKNGGER